MRLYSRAGWLWPFFILLGIAPGIALLNQSNVDPIGLPLFVLIIGFACAAIIADVSVNLVRTIALHCKPED